LAPVAPEAPHPSPPTVPPARARTWPAFLAATAVVVSLAVAVTLAAGARNTVGAARPPATASASPTAAGTTAATAGPPATADTPQSRYVDRLCASGELLVSLGDSATAPQPTGDPAVARRDFLAAADRSIATVEVALVDFAALRDEAPTAEIRTRFGLIVDEFTSARRAFTRARAGVAASDPMTLDAYRTGITRYADGVRSIAFAAQLLKDVTLPPEYTAATASAPRCTD
jgi:hypothetical protein